METELIGLFLFIALFIGWFLGYSAGSKRNTSNTSVAPPQDIKHRLQLLFDTYSDEAIDQFIQGLEVRPDTLPLHISIGKHFRTEGEVDKAILVHQNLMAHPELSDLDSEPIIYELAKDYRAAGLFDRAEALLMQLRGSKGFGLKSRKLLLDVYEREQDWEDAVAIAQQIDLRKHPEVSLRSAYYWCELAAQKQLQHNLVEARMALRKALAADKSCVRAYLMLAEIDMHVGAYQQAIKQLKQVAIVAPEYTVLALPLLQACSVETGSLDRYHRYLEQLFADTGQVQVMLAIVDAYLKQGDEDKAGDYLDSVLAKSPDLPSLKARMDLADDTMSGIDGSRMRALRTVLADLYAARPAYQCGHCGFSGDLLNWLCPSCRNWQTTKPRLDYVKTADVAPHKPNDKDER